MNDLLKTTIFAGVAVVLTGLAFFTTRDRQAGDCRRFRRPGAAVFRRIQRSAGLHRPGSRRLRFVDGHGLAISRDVQG